MRVIEIVKFPEVDPETEFVVDLPADTQILKFILRLEAQTIQTREGVRVDVSAAIRVLVDRSKINVPRRFVMLHLKSKVPDNAEYIDSLNVTLPDGQRCELDLFEVRPDFRAAIGMNRTPSEP